MAQILIALGAIVLYPIALITSITSIIWRRMARPAGILAVLTGLLWMLGLSGAAILQLVTVGYGAYATVLGGVLIVMGYFVSKPKMTSSNS